MATPPVPRDSQADLEAPRGVDAPARILSPLVERLAGGRPYRVALDDIDCTDQRFQCRLLTSHRDLIDSLRDHGQLNPVILWGSRAPYLIVDGFRRIEAISALGGDSVQAVFVHARDEAAVFAVSFAENVRRKSLTAHDKANAIWRAVNLWQMGKRDVAAALGLSVRQVDRYLQLLELSDTLLEAVRDGRLSMAHAVLLHRANLSNPSEWIDEIAAGGISAEGLKRRLRRTAPRHRPTSYLVRNSKGFRLRAVRYRRDMSDAEKRRIRDSLEAALKLIMESVGSSASYERTERPSIFRHRRARRRMTTP